MIILASLIYIQLGYLQPSVERHFTISISMPQFFESENAGNAKRYVSLTPPMHNKRHLQSQQHCSEELDGLIVGIVLLSSLASLSILNNLILSLHQLLQVGLEDLLHGDEVLTMNIEPAEVLALLLRS